MCFRCYHTENADTNAAKVLKQRGIIFIRSDKFSKLSKSKNEKTQRISARKKAGKKLAKPSLERKLASLDGEGYASLPIMEAKRRCQLIDIRAITFL